MSFEASTDNDNGRNNSHRSDVSDSQSDDNSDDSNNNFDKTLAHRGDTFDEMELKMFWKSKRAQWTNCKDCFTDWPNKVMSHLAKNNIRNKVTGKDVVTENKDLE